MWGNRRPTAAPARSSSFFCVFKNVVIGGGGGWLRLRIQGDSNSKPCQSQEEDERGKQCTSQAVAEVDL